MDANLTAVPAAAPPDLRQIDATLANLRRAEHDVSALVMALAEALDAVETRPDDLEAARRVTMAGLRMRGEAAGLACQFAALAQPDGGGAS